MPDYNNLFSVNYAGAWAQADLQRAYGLLAGQTYVTLPPPVKELKIEAIIPGEIIAWRLWRLEKERLHSYYMDQIVWPFDGALKIVGRVGDHSSSGIHAYKTLRDLKQHYSYVFHMPCSPELVYGQVALWGEVVEHEIGYRAEYAKPVSLFWPSPRWLFPYLRLRDLRKAYGL